MKRHIALAFCAGLILAATSLSVISESRSEPIEVHASRIPLYPDRPGERRAGSLIYRGGLVLQSNSRDFGGLSDLAVSADGSEILAISDAAHWLRAKLTYDAAGDLAGLNSANIAPMLDMQGRPLSRPENDSEGLTLERPNDLYGSVAVSFERDVRIWRYDLSKGFDARPNNVPIGDWVKPLHDNQQLEAITLIKPDTLLAFAEAKVNPGEDIPAALESYPGGSTAMTRLLSVVPHDPFAITSAANAPDGGVYLLERRLSLFGGLGMELRHIPAAEIHEGGRLNGEVLADLLFQDSNIDNMEGIAVRRGPNGEIFVYLISDDNFLPLQRTLLLMFEVR